MFLSLLSLFEKFCESDPAASRCRSAADNVYKFVTEQRGQTPYGNYWQYVGGAYYLMLALRRI